MSEGKARVESSQAEDRQYDHDTIQEDELVVDIADSKVEYGEDQTPEQKKYNVESVDLSIV